MFDKKEIETLKNQLVKLFDNYISLVSKKANISRPTAYKFFNFQKIRTENAAMLYDAGLELIQEHTNKQQSRSRKARLLLNGEDQTSLKLN
jgi:hypothetical protein